MFFQFFLQFPAVQFSVLCTFLFQPTLLPSDCRFFFSSFPSEKLPSSLRFLMLCLNFAFTIPFSVPRRPFLLPNLSLRQSAVLAFFRLLTQELMLGFPSARALSSTARPRLISKLPAYASLPGLSPVRASLGDSFGRFLPTHLRASRPTALLPILRSFLQISFTFVPALLCTFPASLPASPLSCLQAFNSIPVSRNFIRRLCFPFRFRFPYSPRFLAAYCFQYHALPGFLFIPLFPASCFRSPFALNTSLRLCPTCFPLSLSPGCRLGLPLPCALSYRSPSAYF